MSATLAVSILPFRKPTAGRRLDPQRLGAHMDRLYRAAWGLCGSREEAEDLVQETYVRVLRKPRFLRSEDDLAYLMRALRNTFFDARRAGSRGLQTISPPIDLESFEDHRAVQAESRIDIGELFRVISELPEGFRDAVIAIDLLGLSYEEAARALKVREATIASRVYRGRQRLVDALTAE
jgi:RNA polymerase sigma-70 factor (ECF subfamily)